MLVINNLRRIFRRGLSLSEIEEKISNSESILQENPQQISKNNAEIEQELQAAKQNETYLKRWDDYYSQVFQKTKGLLTIDEQTELVNLLNKFYPKYSKDDLNKMPEPEKLALSSGILLDDVRKQREIENKVKQILLCQIHNASKAQLDESLAEYKSFPMLKSIIPKKIGLVNSFPTFDWDRYKVTKLLIRFNPEYPEKYIENLSAKERRDLIDKTLSDDEKLQREDNLSQKQASPSHKRLTKEEKELLSRYSSDITLVLDGIVAIILKYDGFLGEDVIKGLSEDILLSLINEILKTANEQNAVDQILTIYNFPLQEGKLDYEDEQQLSTIVSNIDSVNKLLMKYKPTLTQLQVESLTSKEKLAIIDDIQGQLTIAAIHEKLKIKSPNSETDKQQSIEDNLILSEYLNYEVQDVIADILAKYTSYSIEDIKSLDIAEKEMLLKILLRFKGHLADTNIKGTLTEEDIKELSTSNRLPLAKYILISKKDLGTENATLLSNYINRVEDPQRKLEKLLADFSELNLNYVPLPKAEKDLLSKYANRNKAEQQRVFKRKEIPYQSKKTELRFQGEIEKSNKKVTELQEMNAKLEQEITYERGRLIKYYEQHALAEKATGKEEFTYASQVRDHIGEQIQQINKKLASNKKSSNNSISKEIGLKIEKAVALYKELQLSDRETHSSLVSENIANAVSTLGSMAKAPTIGITKTIQRGANLTATIVTSPLRLQRYLSNINNETPYNGMPVEKMSKDLAEIIRDKMKGLEDKIRRM